MSEEMDALAARVKEAAEKVHSVMPGHGVRINAGYVLNILADREKLKADRDKARKTLEKAATALKPFSIIIGVHLKDGDEIRLLSPARHELTLFVGDFTVARAALSEIQSATAEQPKAEVGK